MNLEYWTVGISPQEQNIRIYLDEYSWRDCIARQEESRDGCPEYALIEVSEMRYQEFGAWFWSGP